MSITSEEDDKIVKKYIHIDSFTWLKGNHALYDYEFTRNVTRVEHKFQLFQSYLIISQSSTEPNVIIKQYKRVEIPVAIDHKDVIGCWEIKQQHSKFVIKVIQMDQIHSLFFDSSSFAKQPLAGESEKIETASFIVRTLKDNQGEQKGYLLKTGQVAKFGNVEYAVTVIHNQDEESIEQNFQTDSETVDLPKQAEDSTFCRICLSEQQFEPDGFFCRPCSCSGTQSTVHFQCLFNWCRFKAKKENSGLITKYNLSKLKCEICLRKFPRLIKHGNNRFDLLPIEKPKGTYLILTEKLKSSDRDKSVIVVKYGEGAEITIGRLNSNVLLTDISVSRKHAKLIAKNDEFYLFDTKSKFGTTISSKDLKVEIEKQKRGIQIGKSVLTFCLCKQEV